MESCYFPIEVCERIIDAGAPVFASGTSPWVTRNAYLSARRALYACSLTCRAWRTRAQWRLCRDVHLFTELDITFFTAALHIRPDLYMSNTAALHLSSLGNTIDLKAASSLFMHPLPGLKAFTCLGVNFDTGPRVLRMRLPFFSYLEKLELWSCIFASPRVPLDVVWACPNLSSLVIEYCQLSRRGAHSTANQNHLSTVCEHLRACERLTSLQLDWTFRDDTAMERVRGGAFGSAISDLQIRSLNIDQVQSLALFLPNSFPKLSKIHLMVDPRPRETDSEAPPPSVLAVLSGNLARPEKLKTVILERTWHCSDPSNAAYRELNCVTHLARQGDETMASGEALETRLSGLENLTVSLHPECVEQRGLAEPAQRAPIQVPRS